MTRRRGGGSYSRFVAALKVALPTLAVVLLSLVVIWPQLTSGPDKSSPLTFARLAAPQQKTQTMQDARYHGTDKSNQPFTITSELAKETEPGSQKTQLTRPRADITLKSGAWVLLEADQGLYDQVAQYLDLEGSVAVYHDAGYEMHTTRLGIDLVKGEAKGVEPVNGKGPRGEIRGQGLTILENGQIIKVTGKSRLLIYGSSPKAAAPAPAPAPAKAGAKTPAKPPAKPATKPPASEAAAKKAAPQ